MGLVLFLSKIQNTQSFIKDTPISTYTKTILRKGISFVPLIKSPFTGSKTIIGKGEKDGDEKTYKTETVK